MDHWSWWCTVRLSWNDSELPDSLPVPVERMKKKSFLLLFFLKVKDVLASIVYYCNKSDLTKVILVIFIGICRTFYIQNLTDSLHLAYSAPNFGIRETMSSTGFLSRHVMNAFKPSYVIPRD